MAIKRICFDGDIPLRHYLAAVRNNWEGAEELRQRALNCPHWGDDCEETNAVARRLYEAICHSGDGIPNERGGGWQTAFYVYRPMIAMSQRTGATPDGRRAGDWLAQGITPSRLHKGLSITDTINSFATLDARLAAGSRVLDLNIPINASTSDSLDALERSAAKQGVGMLQINCVSKEQLLDAQEHPEKYPDLIVRLYGYSARFVTLPRLYQDEFIARSIYQ